VIILTGGLSACKHGFHARGFDEFDLDAMTERIASRLDLTESQKAELDRIAGEIAEKAKTMHSDSETCHQELADLVRQEEIQLEILDEMVAEKMVKIQAMADFITERIVEFHEKLTPEQREKIAEQIENHTSGNFRHAWR
jgi:hypothetical protein